jgi:hypothetical protein
LEGGREDGRERHSKAIFNIYLSDFTARKELRGSSGCSKSRGRRTGLIGAREKEGDREGKKQRGGGGGLREKAA